MKITDLLSRIHKGSSDPDGGKAVRLIQPVEPVGHVGKLTLVPGQLIQGEVVGEDVNGLLLLKLAGEIISARTPIKLELGQRFWFEVQEAGDNPLLNLASRKGAVQELLRDIMATRPLLVKTPPGVSPSPPSALQAGPAPASQRPEGVLPMPPAAEGGGGKVPLSPVNSQGLPGAAVLAPDGSLPPEAARLVRALVIYMAQPETTTVAQGNNVSGQSPPLIKTIVSLIREGQIPASLQKVEAFQTVIRPSQPFVAAALAPEGQGPEPVKVGGDTALPSSPVTSMASSSQPQAPSIPVSPPPSAPALFAPETVKILNSLVAIAGIKVPVNGESGALQPALNPDQNLAEILTLIAQEGRIPPPLQRLSPVQVLMGAIPGSPAGMQPGEIHPGLLHRDEISGEGVPAANALLPLQFAATQQGAESLPAQLRLLASLMGLGSREAALEGWQEIEDIFRRFSEAEAPAAARKLASFYEAHARVNSEAAPQGQSDFYIMPTIFSGQTGWGEWLWRRERSSGDNDANSQENLVFFLEMSNLGALTVQVILNDKKLRGQIVMADKRGSELVALLLPGLQDRLEAFGYDVVDFSCSCQPLNVMQELKESLHDRTGSRLVSLLDLQV